ALGAEKQADIRVTADRSGDEVLIAASATVTAGGDVPKSARPRLRVVLVEKTVRYQGGNGIRLHHNVVRAFPGGVEGKPLDGGKAEVTATVNLSDLRKRLTAYLDAFPDVSGRSFPQPPPPIDLDGLAVVAFVQDDADHAIWHGVHVPVKGANP
ncbi:MAG: hypothetical protein LC745_11310, partial [Planctomycetia bacterium]|nr:hypothetical protein [Planctomycetia bacterium]